MGLPEVQYALAEAAIYLATAPKSNSCSAYFKALQEVEQEGITEVPDHLKDSSRDAKALGHGEGYLYPHSFPDHWVAQQYLPSRLQGKHWYEPGELGYEKVIKERLEKWRKARQKGADSQ